MVLRSRIDMNKQIAELASKSGFDIGVHNGLVLGNFSTMHRCKNLVELVIKECLTVVNQSNGVGDDDVIRITLDIKNHFQIELTDDEQAYAKMLDKN